MKIGFIGAGNMAGAIVRGLVTSGVAGSSLLVYDVCSARLAELFNDCGIQVCSCAEEVIEGSDAVVLAVKPQVYPTLLPQLAPTVARCRPLIVSIAAGVKIASVAKWLGEELAITRVMPNINAKVGEAITAMCYSQAVTEEQKEISRRIFEAVGEVISLDEKHFSVFASMASASPAFTFLYVDALAAAGVRYGLTKADALKIARQAVLGSVLLMKETDTHPRTLMDQVCSPAGITIEGVAALQRDGFETAVQDAVAAAVERDKALAGD